MFKLVAVAGKLRGQEFTLNNGENVLGRSDEHDLVLPVDMPSYDAILGAGFHLKIT